LGAARWSADSVATTIDAEVDEKGNIRPKEPGVAEAALLSEASLAADWQRPEEDAAWAQFNHE